MSGIGEELGTAPWWRATDGRRGIAVVSSLALVAALVAWIVAGQSGSGRASGPPPAISVETDAAIAPLNIDVDSLLRCPSTLACRATESVPPGTSALVAQYLPGGYNRRTVTVTEVADHRLRFRAVNSVAGAVELLVIVSVPDLRRPDAIQAADPTPGAAIRYARKNAGRFEIQVQFTGPPGGTPPVRLAADLAADRRLLALA